MVVLDKDKIEYQEANALLRHYNSVEWMAGSIFFSAAFAILGLTWEVEESNLLVIFAVTSVGLFTFGFLVERRFGFYCDTILERIWELERQMGMNLHLSIKRKDREATLKSPILHSLQKIRYLTVFIMVVFILFWILRIVLPFLL